METRKCSKCGKELSITSFYFSKKTQKFYNWCKNCKYVRLKDKINVVKDRNSMSYADHIRKAAERGQITEEEARAIIRENKNAKINNGRYLKF